MTCSAGAGVFLKLSRLFVKIRRWVLVRMSLNCKLSGLNGRLPNCSKLKKAKEPLHGPNSVRKWRRELLFFFCLLVSVVLGSIGFLLSFNHGTLWGKEKAPKSCEEKAQILLQHFNLSKNQLHALTSLLSESDQMTSLQCTKELGSKVQLSDGITCALSVTCSEMQQLHKQHRWVADNDEPRDQCPVQDENISRKPSLSMLDDSPVPFISQSRVYSISANNQICEKTILQSGALVDCVKEHCESFCTIIKVSWLLLVVAIVSCKMSGFHLQLWRNQKNKVGHQ